MEDVKQRRRGKRREGGNANALLTRRSVDSNDLTTAQRANDVNIRVEREGKSDGVVGLDERLTAGSDPRAFRVVDGGGGVGRRRGGRGCDGGRGGSSGGRNGGGRRGDGEEKRACRSSTLRLVAVRHRGTGGAGMQSAFEKTKMVDSARRSDDFRVVYDPALLALARSDGHPRDVSSLLVTPLKPSRNRRGRNDGCTTLSKVGAPQHSCPNNTTNASVRPPSCTPTETERGIESKSVPESALRTLRCILPLAVIPSSRLLLRSLSRWRRW